MQIRTSPFALLVLSLTCLGAVACGSSGASSDATDGGTGADATARDGASSPDGASTGDSASPPIDGSSPADDAALPPDDAATTTDGATAACSVAADCRLYSNHCDACTCMPLGTSDVNPVCTGTILNCFVDPCEGKAATCDHGHCAAK